MPRPPRHLLRDASVLLVAAVFGLTRGPNALRDEAHAFSDPLSRIPAAVATASEAALRLAEREGKHLGFDTYAYPGDEAMRAWRTAAVPYEWVGYYLPTTPCHKGSTWAGKRERLANMGWGMAVVYVGQQTWDRTPSDFETKYVKRRVLRTESKRVYRKVRVNGKLRTRYTTTRVKVHRTVSVPVRVRFDASKYALDQCNTNLVSGARGTLEGQDAVAHTLAEGFKPGTVIFLDLEQMDVVPQRMRDYYKAWTRQVLADGRYRPGYYVHKGNAQLVYDDVTPLFAAHGITKDPSFWIAGGRDFDRDREPTGVGHAFASVWQGILDIHETHNGIRLPIDVNVAAVSSPSTASLGD